MLVGFSVSNYKSFQDTQKISFIASKIARHKDHISTIAGRKVLKSALIFGANASGKSNLIKAVKFSKDIILLGTDRIDLNKKYFRINSESYKIPGIFEYRIITDNVEYSYGIAISYDKKEIIAEWLVKIKSGGSEEIIFNREVDEDGISSVTSEKTYFTEEENVRMNVYLEDFRTNISSSFRKKTILSDIALRVNDKQGYFKEIKSVYKWFNSIIILFPVSQYCGLNNIAEDDLKKSLFTEFMSFFDTGIVSVEGKEETFDFDKIVQRLNSEDAEKIKIDISNASANHPIMLKDNKQIYVLKKDEHGNIVYNKIQLNHGNDEDLFEYADESDGTKRLFDLLPLFYENKRDCVILIDEIDRSLHTNLTKRFMELFYELTKDNTCQLMVTTHDSNLLDLEMLRQDEIWFIERQKDHSSKVYSLNKFKERFDKKIDKEYLLGRYGAIPIFDETILDEENFDD